MSSEKSFELGFLRINMKDNYFLFTIVYKIYYIDAITQIKINFFSRMIKKIILKIGKQDF
jgi:hypothetical protein